LPTGVDRCWSHWKEIARAIFDDLFETVAAQRTKRDLQLRYSVAVAQQRLPGFLEGKTTPNGRLAAGRLEHVVKLICLGWCTAVGHVDAIAKRA